MPWPFTGLTLSSHLGPSISQCKAGGGGAQSTTVGWPYHSRLGATPSRKGPGGRKEMNTGASVCWELDMYYTPH